MDEIMTVEDVPEEAILLTDSQDTEPIKEQYAEAEDLDGFFVLGEESKYTAIWGFEGIIPYLHKSVWRVI